MRRRTPRRAGEELGIVVSHFERLTGKVESMNMELDSIEPWTNAPISPSTAGCWEASMDGADILALGISPLDLDESPLIPFGELLENGFPFARPEAARKPGKG